MEPDSTQRETQDKHQIAHAPVHCLVHSEVQERLARMEKAFWGDPTDSKSTAIVPTLSRLSAYLDAACWAWRAAIAGVPASAALYAFGRQVGWW